MQTVPESKSLEPRPLPDAPPGMSASQWAISATLIAAILVAAFALRRHAAKLHAPQEPKPDAHAAELNHITRDLIAQLDRRAADLESLIAAADERIATLRSTPSAPSVVIEPKDPLHARIHALADAGRSPIDIARETGCPTGQVELILALRRVRA